MVKNSTSALAARRDSPKRRVSIVISRRTRSELQSVRSLVIRVTKHFTTAHLTTLIFAPRIQLKNPLSLIENDPPIKPQTRLLLKKPRRLLRLARVQRQNHQPPFKHPLQVPVGKLIQFLSLRTLFLPRRKTSRSRTDNTGLRSVPESVVRTGSKPGIIFASQPLSRIFADQSTVFKVNFAFGFIPRNTETGALQYHHPSANNNLVLEQPFLVSNQDDLDRLYQEINNIDFLEWVRQQRPNSKWIVDVVTNVTWFVTKLRDHPIGRGKYLPGYIVDNRGIEPLESNSKTGKPYEDTPKN